VWLVATKDKVLESLTNVNHYFQQKGLKYVIPKSLVEVLKSQGLVKEGDMAAYDALFCSNDIARSGLEQQVAFDYQEAAAIYGVTTGLPLVAE
jgi:hypothetical protein